jgi:hypothetical protein
MNRLGPSYAPHPKSPPSPSPQRGKGGLLREANDVGRFEGMDAESSGREIHDRSRSTAFPERV